MYSRNKQYSFQEVLSKLMKYCSYQDRSKLEVRRKAYTLGANKIEIEKLIEHLEDEKFLNEHRFTASYVRGKLEIKRWGKYKIREGLKSKGIAENLVQEYLSKVSEDTFTENIKYLIKKRGLNGKLYPEELAKEYRYFLSRGYEYDQLKRVFEEEGLIV